MAVSQPDAPTSGGAADAPTERATAGATEGATERATEGARDAPAAGTAAAESGVSAARTGVPARGGAHAAARGPGGSGAWWSAFRRWRRGRPFWGGLLVVLGGLEILAAVWAPLPVIMRVGMQGAIGYLIPVIIVLCGALIVFTPGQRILNSCIAMVLGLATWLTSNLGGFFAGMLLTLVGAAMAFAWRSSPDAK